MNIVKKKSRDAKDLVDRMERESACECLRERKSYFFEQHEVLRFLLYEIQFENEESDLEKIKELPSEIEMFLEKAVEKIKEYAQKLCDELAGPNWRDAGFEEKFRWERRELRVKPYLKPLTKEDSLKFKRGGRKNDKSGLWLLTVTVTYGKGKGRRRVVLAQGESKTVWNKEGNYCLFAG